MQTKFGTNWRILKFWGARARASRCARKICWHFSLTFRPEVDVYQIWFIFDDSLLRYDNDLIFYKMAPGWRHDDLMTLKKLIRLEIIEPDDWQKFEGNWPCRFRVNVCTKKCTEEIKKMWVFVQFQLNY